MTTRPAISALLLASLFAGPAPAQDEAAAPDLSAWSCRFCAFEDGWKGWVEPGIGYVSDVSFRFGDYTGLEERGGFGDLGAALRYRGAESGDALDLRVDHLGLDSRAFGIRAGRQGRLQLRLDYESLPHLIAHDSRSPFAPDTGQLPGGWFRGGSTQGMATLDSSLRGAPLRQERERTGFGLVLAPHPLADVRFDFRRDEIHGTGATGASFMTLASQLPRPIDQIVDRADLSLGLRNALGQAQLVFGSSFFSNDLRALAWQNPYSGPTAGATTGQMALAPDNEAHRLSLTLASAPGTPLQLSGQLALGRLEQNERFLPATVNPDETVALPRNSLDGRVDTTLASARAGWKLGHGLRLSADVLHDERDNRTPVAAYTQVVMDTFTGGVRANAPFGFTRDRWRVSVERTGRPRLAAGFDDDTRERRMVGVGETRERTLWGRLGWRPFDGSDLRLRLAHRQREGTGPGDATGAAALNPLARNYNTADRRRDEARGDFSLGGDGFTSGVNVTWARDEYPDTVIGRTSGRELGYGLDGTLQPVAGLAIAGFASHRRQENGQAGSERFGLPDWFAEQEDVTNVVGLNLSWQAPRGIELGADYVLSSSEGSIAMLAGASETGFPLLLTRWHDVRLFSRYALRPDLTLRLDLVREVYTARDWTLDGVAPDTVPNLLALGQGTQSGDVTAVLLGLRYEFAGAAPAGD